MVHWQRFPAFRHVKHELKKPHLTMNDRDRGAVFMRWKERFLVPDHRVQDINGASFAGSLSSFSSSVYREVVDAQRAFSLFLQRLQHFTAINDLALVLGFYYVCVDFNPQPAPPTMRPVAQPVSSTPETDEYVLPPLPAAKGEAPQAIRVRRDSSVKRGGRAPSVGPRSGTPVPTMSGFYFHQNSEPCVITCLLFWASLT